VNADQTGQKETYEPPVLRRLGSVAEVTKTGTTAGKEGPGAGNTVRLPKTLSNPA
jgi:hypothetical protein